MPHVATMGTSSCATISIGGFKSGDSYTINEEYINNGTVPETEGLSVKQFYSQVLYPVSQPLGKTRDLPFEKLMQDIKSSSLHSKLCMITLNRDQFLARDGYWRDQLKKWDFKLITKCDNDIGSTNYIYMRNPNEVGIGEGEE